MKTQLRYDNSSDEWEKRPPNETSYTEHKNKWQLKFQSNVENKKLIICVQNAPAASMQSIKCAQAVKNNLFVQ